MIQPPEADVSGLVYDTMPEPFYQREGVKLWQGHVLAVLRRMPSESVQCCVTSPPYLGLRSYGTEPQIWGGTADCNHDWQDANYQRRSNDGGEEGRLQTTNAGAIGRDEPVQSAFCRHCNGWRGELGLEPDVSLYVAHLVEIFREVRRVLRTDGTFWLNIGDSYNGSGGAGGDYAEGGLREGQPRYPGRRQNGLKNKDLMMVPARLALALQEDGWWLRSEITWCKKAPMPESVTDRPTSATEKIYLLTKADRYFYDSQGYTEPSVSDHPSGNGYKREPRLTYEGRGNEDQWQPQPTRQLRNFWVLGPDPNPNAHFATFPEAIPERAILLGTSAKGCCPVCSAPWRRVVEKRPDNTGYSHGPGGKKARDPRGNGASDKSSLATVARWESTTTGWQPTCACNREDVVPCVVLDPFAGSGTSLSVASRLGRHAQGIDLNPDYCRLAVDRTRQQAMVLEGV